MVFWGEKTIATFDVWSIEHLVTGLCVGALLYRRESSLLTYYLMALLIAYAWETLEHYLETGLAGAVVEYWFQGVEHWTNRLFADPILVMLGAYLFCHAPYLKWPARTFSVVWLFVHIFLFPHSMYLHSIALYT